MGAGMIGFLRGRLVDAHRYGHVIIDVQGVGYDVTIANPPAVPLGTEIQLYIHTSVRPDAIVLFGFHSAEERALFELLIETPGVGPSTALGAVRSMPVAQLEAAIRSGDQKLISTIPGIGLKTANRVILELRGKFASGDAVSDPTEMREEIVSGLLALGFAKKEIAKALKGLALPEDDAEALKLALSRMASS
jgi:Holliday junction DNA helicase RuvA